MRFLFCPSWILLFSFCVILISPTQSLVCSSLKIRNSNKEYANCIQLPTFNSTLHFTYNVINSSLSIAFSATPSDTNGWIAWAINPMGIGMVGSQALVAFKDKGFVVAKTYNISSYSSIVEGKLSFEIWDLEARVANDGKMVIYCSLKIPAGAKKLNQVWQVGAAVSNGQLMKHELGKANLGSMGELNLVETVSSISTPPELEPFPKLQLSRKYSGHGSRVNAGIWIFGLISLLIFM
ncbi:hypothetical protein ERO13_D07G166500v2 [Gossypium hirsutum]|uniref:DOMON domain-containing protein n=2 Tax=Gossypium TaxID=3633 RepID=A0A5J5QTZ8_GOSBA|nr:hypothetical protein ES319_D07G182000v1 [Gossypium barbadense]KAG4139022.1 hypothetical protein ERO13_D07G166500v2 [Gossypium hirsutum]TYG62030.1 hypothetical protein ES288_D07G195600v1 [Gossypium darwinii]